ncbi:MAG TPA: hypothetical protein VGG29_01780 [Caulobacteraceae bacterium]|jgi:hypothetical protein
MTSFPVLDAVSGWGLDPDPPPPDAAFTQALLTLAVLDEITAQAPSVALVASTSTPGAAARASLGGAAGLVAEPLTLYRAGSAAGAPLQLDLAGPGYIPVALTTSLGAEAGYPGAFTPADLGIVELRRAPVAITGRVVSASAGPLVGATISLEGIWPALADLTNPLPAPPDLVAIDSPLYAPRDLTATVARRNLAPGAAVKALLAPGNVGDAAVRLSDWQALAVGDILGFDIQDPGRAEYLAVTAITPLGVSAALPASVTLAFPLARPHAAGSAATPMTPAAAGSANALARAGAVGDVSLFPAAMAGLDAGMSAVVVSGGGAPDEFHTAALVVAATDIDGYARLPPLHRVAQLRLRVHHASQPTDLRQDVMPTLGARSIDLSLSFP